VKSLFFIAIFITGIAVTASIGANVAMDKKVGPMITRAPITFTGSVSQGSDSTQHSFTVAATATKVEVSLAFSGSYDFDLSLWDNQNRRTGGWTAADHSQKSEIPNDSYSGYSANPETITVDPPATSGTWKVGCYSYRGTGTYTITVTVTADTSDTTPPSVSLTAPTGGTVTGSITVSATASDNVGVDHVVFAVDGSNFATDSSSPYSTTLDTTSLTDGSHTIRATAYDAAGNTDVDTVTVTVDNSGPDNEITSGVPVTGTLTSVGQTEMWFIDVATNCEQMESILTCGNDDFDLYGRLGAEPTTSTYDWRGYTYGGEEVTTTNPGAGRWYIMVRDYSGSGAYELTVTLTYSGPDTVPPTISISSPSNGQTVTVDDVAVSWSGSDADSGIDYYEVRIDSGSWIYKATSTSHTFSNLADGSHTAEVRAWDNAGNSNSDSVTFTVDTTVVNDVKKYAVIVGISDYKAISDLSYCDEDATDWYYHLKNTLDYDQVWVYGDGHSSNYPVWNGYATEYNIKQALINMVNLADDNDIIAFTTSGHGSGNGYGSSYICAWDCGSGESGQDGNFYDTELEAILDGAIAERIFVFIDHCYSGGFGPELMSMPNKARVYLTTTCTDDGYGYDDPSHNNGAWTYYFLEYAWINHYGGSASVSMETVFDYAHAAYPHSGGDDSEEYDGNTGSSFYMA